MDIKKVENPEEGVSIALDLIYKKCGKKTVLFLSGGNTPKPLYEKLASEQKLKVGAVGMVDDRYSFHQQYSNQFMIEESGLLSFLNTKNIAFYPVLKFGLSREKTAAEYDETVRFLLTHFPKSIAILGIGTDGHTASITPTLNDLNHLSDQLVTDVRNFPAEIRERITLTLSAISKMDLIIILAFGKEKKEGIKIAIKTFFSGKEISKKTILITDQPVSPIARRGGKI